MRVVIADSFDGRRRHACLALSELSGVSVVGDFEDLTGTFNAVEHAPPTIVLVAPELAAQPTFETMEVLFKCLAVRWMILGKEADLSKDTAQLRISKNNGFLDVYGSKDEITAALSRRFRGATVKAPSSPFGLLQSSTQCGSEKVVLIGSSTGGVDALIRVLGSFPSDCPPTLIVQHTGGAFSEGLARLLDRRIQPQVREACDGEKPMRGTVLIAPGSDAHLVLETQNGLRCRLKQGPRVSGHRPSVDALFSSGAAIAKDITCVILTGMGRDGAEGMLELKQKGARTIAQDEETSVVYGMPRHAVELGGAMKIMPLVKIGPEVLRPVGNGVAT